MRAETPEADKDSASGPEQAELSTWGVDTSILSGEHRDVYEAVECGPYGAREYARKTGRSPGTISDHLARAREKIEQHDDQEAVDEDVVEEGSA